MATPYGIGSILRVIKDYRPDISATNHLSVDRGDIVEVIDMIDDDCGDINSNDYVRVINRSLGPSNGDMGWIHKQIVVENDDEDDEPFGTAAAQPSITITAAATADPIPQIRPSSTLIPDYTQTTTTQQQQQQPTLKNEVSPGSKFIARYEYLAQRSDELSLAPDDILYIIVSPEGGWWRGMKGPAGKDPAVGWFPSNYVEPAAADEEQKPTDRQKSWYQKIIGGGGNGGNSNGTGGTGSKHSRSLSAGSTTTATKSIKHSQSGPLNSLPETEDYSDEITISDGPRSAPVDGKAAGKFPFLRKQNSDLPVVAPAPSGKHKRRNTTTAIPDSANASNSGNTLNVDDELLEDAPDMEDSWRSNLTDDEFERLTAQERRRQDVIWELISTERDYVRDLKIIIYMFMKPIVEKKLLNAKNIQLIFANIEDILVINQNFLETLEKRRSAERLVLRIGDILLEAAEKFVVYAAYCCERQEAIQRLQKLISSTKSLSTFVEETYSKSKATRGLDLASFLLKPIQRICKYPLLLKETIKHTPESNPDYGTLTRALTKLQNVINIINQGTPSTVSNKRLVDIENGFQTKINLASPSRYLVREDSIQLLYGEVKKPRHLFLFNDLVIIARKDWRDKFHLTEKAELAEIKITNVRHHNETMHVFELVVEQKDDGVVPVAPNRYLIAMPTKQAKSAWIESIVKLIGIKVDSKVVKADDDKNALSSYHPVDDEEDSDVEDASSGSKRSNVSPSGKLASSSPLGKRHTMTAVQMLKAEMKKSSGIGKQTNSMSELTMKNGNLSKSISNSSSANLQGSSNGLLASSNASLEGGSNVAAVALKNRVKDLEKSNALNDLEIKRLTAKLAEVEKKNSDLTTLSTNHVQQMTDLNAENMKLQHQMHSLQMELSDAQRSVESAGKEIQMKEESWNRQREQIQQHYSQDRSSLERKLEAQKEEMRQIFDRELQIVKTQADKNAQELAGKIEEQQQALDRKTEQITKLENDRLQQMMAFSQDMLSRAHGIQNADALQKNINELQAALQISQDALVSLENERNYTAEADVAAVAKLKVAIESAQLDYQNQQKSFEKLLQDRDILVHSKEKEVAALQASLAEVAGCVRDLESQKQVLRRELEARQQQMLESDAVIGQKEIIYMRQQAEIQQLSDKLVQAESTVNDLRRELDASRSKTSDLDSAINRMALEGQECQVALENCITELKSNSLMFEALQSDYNECQSELTRLFEVEKEFECLKQQAGDQRSRILELENEKVVLNGEVAELKHKLRAAGLLKKKWKDAEVDKANLSVEIKSLSSNSTSQSERISALEHQLGDSQKEIEARIQEISELKTMLTTTQTELQASTIVLRDIQNYVVDGDLQSNNTSSVSAKNQHLISIVEQVHQLQVQRANLSDELELLRSRHKDLEQLTATQEAEMLKAVQTIKSLEAGADTQRRKYEGILAVAEDEKKRQEVKIEAINGENAELARNGRLLTQKIEELQEQLAKAQKTLINHQVTTVNLHERIEKMEIDASDRDREFLYQKGELLESRAKVEQLEQELRDMQMYPNAKQLTGMAQRLKDLESENAALSKVKAMLETKLAALTRQQQNQPALRVDGKLQSTSAVDEELKPSDLTLADATNNPSSAKQTTAVSNEAIIQLQQENSRLQQENAELIAKLAVYAAPQFPSVANIPVTIGDQSAVSSRSICSPSPQARLPLPSFSTKLNPPHPDQLKEKFEICAASLSNLSQLRFKYDQQIVKMLGIDKVNNSAQNVLQYMETAMRFESISQTGKTLFNKNLETVQAQLKEIESTLYILTGTNDQQSVSSLKQQLDETLRVADDLRARNQRLNSLLAQSGSLQTSTDKMPVPWQKLDVLAKLVEQEWSALIGLIDHCFNGQSTSKVIEENVRAKFILIKHSASASHDPLLTLTAWQEYMDRMQTRINGLAQLLGSLLASMATQATKSINSASNPPLSPSKLASGGVMRAVVKTLKESDNENERLKRHLEWCQQELERVSEMYHELQSDHKRKETELREVKRSLQAKMEQMSEISLERANISQLVMKACDELENLV